MAQTVKNLPAKQEIQVWSLSWEDPLEKEMATRSSILAWRVPWTEEPCRLQSRGCKESDMTERQTFTLLPYLPSMPIITSWCPRGLTSSSLFYFLASPCSMWDHSSLTRDWTHALCRGSTESWPPDRQGSPKLRWHCMTDGLHPPLSIYCVYTAQEPLGSPGLVDPMISPTLQMGRLRLKEVK